jgi:transcriptional regulator with XRE-family HTH domain
MAQTTATGLPTIGDVILAWRKYRGMRPTELVRKAGIKKGYLSALEHNKRATPQEAFLAKLADALEVPLQDIYGRRMPPKDGTAVTTSSSKQGVSGQGGQQATADEELDSETEEEQARGAATYSVARPSVKRPARFVGARAEEIEQLIASGGYSEEEEEEVWGVLIEMVKRFNSFKETQRKTRKEDLR